MRKPAGVLHVRRHGPRPDHGSEFLNLIGETYQLAGLLLPDAPTAADPEVEV